MRIAVGFTRAMVPVILPEGGEFLEPFIDIRDQAVFRIINPDARRYVHGRDQNHAIADAAFRERAFHLRSDVNVFAVLVGTERQMLSMKRHICDGTPALDKARWRYSMSWLAILCSLLDDRNPQ